MSESLDVSCISRAEHERFLAAARARRWRALHREQYNLKERARRERRTIVRTAEMLLATPRNEGRLKRGSNFPVVPRENSGNPTLPELGISRKEASNLDESFLLAGHNANLTPEGNGWRLSYLITSHSAELTSHSSSSRGAGWIEVSFPILGSRNDALQIAEIILRDHKAPEIQTPEPEPEQPSPGPSFLAHPGIERRRERRPASVGFSGPV